MITPVIRPLMPEDAPAAVAVWHEGWHDAHGALLPDAVLAVRGLGFFAGRLADWTGAVVGAFVKGDLAGLALVDGDELDQLHVARRHRGIGVGRCLLADIETQAAAAGHTYLRLGCALGNERALHFYEAAGYRRTGEGSYEFAMPAGADPVSRPLVMLRKFIDAGPEVRPARAEDMPAIVALWHETWHDAHAVILPDDVVAERSPDSFAKRLRRLLPDSFVAVVDGEIGGFAALHGDEVDQFYVAAKFRGTGLAKLFLSVLEGALAKRGVEVAVIQCAEGNIRAHRFYSRCGWTDTGVFDLPVYTADGRHAAHPTHLFKKSLR